MKNWLWSPAVLALGLVTLLGCGSTTEPILSPDTDPVPLTLENLRGRWEEQARIYTRLGIQTGKLVDTTAVSATDRIIYEFSGDGDGLVQRVHPDPGQAILRIESNGTVVSWVTGVYQSYAAHLTAERLSLADGLTVAHRLPGDAVASDAQVPHVYGDDRHLEVAG